MSAWVPEQVNVVPGESAEFFGASADEDRQGDVAIHRGTDHPAGEDCLEVEIDLSVIVAGVIVGSSQRYRRHDPWIMDNGQQMGKD